MAIWLLFSASLLAQAEGPAASPQKIAAALAALASEKFDEREAATDFLWRAWPASRSAVESAAKSRDAEVSLRARQILENVRYGLRPDTPAEIVRLTRVYRDGDLAARRAVLSQLRKDQQHGTLLVLLRSESDAGVRQALAREFLNTEMSAAARFIAAGDLAAADETLGWLAEFDPSPGRAHRDYAAYLLVSGKLDARIADLKASGRYREDPREAALLARLLQVQGDLKEARAVAELTDDKYLKSDLYFRLEDWGALAQQGLIPGDPGLENLGFAAAYHRLAGNAAEEEKSIQGLLALAKEDPDEARMCAEALMINGRWKEASDLLSRSHPTGAMELLIGQMRFADALERVGLDRPRDGAAQSFATAMRGLAPGSKELLPTFYRGIAIARTLDRLGEHEEAMRLHAELTTAAKSQTNGSAALLELELSLGLKEAALERAADLLLEEQKVGQVMYRYFGQRSYVASEWWRILQDAFPEKSRAQRLQRLHALLQATAADPGTAMLARQAIDLAEQLPLEKRLERLAAIADVCIQHQELAIARSCLEKQAALALDLKDTDADRFKPLRTVGPLLRLGELELAEKSWERAADAYARAFALNTLDPVPLYLQGYALLQAGQESAGRPLMQRAELLPLADTERRRDLAEALAQHGLTTEALAQWGLILRVGAFEGWEGADDWAVQEAAEQVATSAKDQDPLRAAALWQRYLFYMLKTNTGFLDAGHYSQAVHRIHEARALGLLKAGKTEDGVREAWKAHAALPGDPEFVERVLPLLATAGRAADAEQLFDESFATYDAVCRSFPRSAHHHNGLAWLAARSSRRLDAALTHAQEALRLAPEKPAFLDTLAEVHFRRGEREQALVLAAKAAQLEPMNSHFQSQLRRFREAP